MIDMQLDFSDYVLDRIYEIADNIRPRGDKLNFSCPICGDQDRSSGGIVKTRMWYYMQTDSVHCWKCQYSNTGIGFLADVDGVDIKDITKQYFKENRIESEGSARRKTSHRDEIRRAKPSEPKKLEIDGLLGIKDSWLPIPKDVQPVIDSRRIFDAPYVPKDWKLFYDRTIDRIVIPWMNNGRVEYYQTRSIRKDQKGPKYLFPTDIARPIFNLDRVDTNLKFMYATEGVFDCLFIANAMCVGSIQMSAEQKAILSTKLCNMVFFPDNQWQDASSMRITLKYVEKNPEAYVFIWDKSIKQKDVNEYFVATNGDNLFEDYDYLVSRTFKGIRAGLELKKNM